jgi:Rieske Fe-S protein
MTERSLTRRTILTGAAAVGGAAVLAACGTDAADDTTTDDTGDDAAGDDTGTAGGEILVATSEVPVGGGAIVGAVVVTQPTDGEFKAFSSTCTHQGCRVSSVSDGLITCACHNSQFSIDDGSVVSPPAPSPLPEVSITVEGDQVVRA